MKSSAIYEFGVGSKVIYPAHGIGTIERVEKCAIGGDPEPCYFIRFQKSGMIITAPIRSAGTVGLRCVISKKDVTKVFKILKDDRSETMESNWNKRQKVYLEKIKSGSLFEVASVYRDLYFLRTTKGLSFGEQQVFDNAHKLIVSEIAESKGVGEEKVVKMLNDALTN
jgi:CarD family transcriptional regulator